MDRIQVKFVDFVKQACMWICDALAFKSKYVADSNIG